jgi:hypothetical protein
MRNASPNAQRAGGLSRSPDAARRRAHRPRSRGKIPVDAALDAGPRLSSSVAIPGSAPSSRVRPRSHARRRCRWSPMCAGAITAPSAGGCVVAEQVERLR